MVNVAISLQKDNDHRLEPELSQPELAAIGRITVLWAELEHLLLESTIGIAEVVKVPVPEDAYALSFKKRLRTARALAKMSLKDGPLKTYLLKTFDAIGSVERSRHRVTHGLWNWLPADPSTTIASSDRPSFEFQEKFDFRKLIKFGTQVGRAGFLLRYPGGPDQFYEEQAEAAQQPGGIVSRWWALAAQGKDPENPHLPLSNFLERLKTQRPLQPQRARAKTSPRC
jgi:hypothetical protein